jgi:predicted HD superfamily hydrolase involved in NAD metabolism
MICTFEGIESLLSRYLSAERRAHSRRVGELTAELCARHGLDTGKGRSAGLAHDLAREMPEQQLRLLAVRDGGGVSFLEDRYPVLLHGRAAAAILRETLGIEDPEILEAVACHVTGRPAMGLLARIVFAADFLEPGRGFLSEELRTRILGMDIDRMLIPVLEEIFRHLRLKGRPIAAPALDLFEELHSV